MRQLQIAALVLYRSYILRKTTGSEDFEVTVYRRPDPIPMHRGRPASSVSLGQVRDQEDLHHLVARRIFLAIAAGSYPEGSILPTEQALSQELGVSRTALREAIKGLASKGMLETRRRRGTMVLDRSRWNMLDADVIGWLRRDDSRAVSEQLWETIRALLPALGTMAAARGLSPLRTSPLARGKSDVEARADFLIELARAAGNRFTLSIVASSVTSLATADRDFFDATTRGLTAGVGAQIAQRIGDREEKAAATLLRQAFETELAPVTA